MKVSIITINLNNKLGLHRTLESVKVQTNVDYEHIVVDGGSSDGSVDTLSAFRNDRLKWISERDSGLYHAMNKGIAKATGDYLLFLNSGDYLVAPSVLENLLNGEKGDIDLLYGDLERSFPDGTEDIVTMPDFITVETMMTWTLCHPVTLIHRRLFEDYGLYDERIKIVADWAFFLKVIVLGDASQKHKNVTVAKFMMDGMSSLPENQEKIFNEREWVKANYLSPAFIRFYQDYCAYKNFFNLKWVQRLRRIKNAVVNNKF